MPSIKLTDLIKLLEQNIEQLKAGDPSWTAEQKRKAKAAIEVFKAFKVLSEEQCHDLVQSIPGEDPGNGEEDGGEGAKRKSKKKKGGRGKKKR